VRRIRARESLSWSSPERSRHPWIRREDTKDEESLVQKSFVSSCLRGGPSATVVARLNAIIGNSMQLVKLHRTVGVKVGHVQVGGGAPIVVQSMTMTDTADARATAGQCIELAGAGSELVRVTVNLPEAAAAVPEIKQRMLDAGCTAPLVGDFHYNGHQLLTRYPD